MNCSSAKAPQDHTQVPRCRVLQPGSIAAWGSASVEFLFLRRDHEIECVKFTLLTTMFDDKVTAVGQQ